MNGHLLVLEVLIFLRKLSSSSRHPAGVAKKLRGQMNTFLSLKCSSLSSRRPPSTRGAASDGERQKVNKAPATSIRWYLPRFPGLANDQDLKRWNWKWKLELEAKKQNWSQNIIRAINSGGLNLKNKFRKCICLQEGPNGKLFPDKEAIHDCSPRSSTIVIWNIKTFFHWIMLPKVYFTCTM